MAKRFRLRDIEAARGNLSALIPPLVNQHGQAGAARELGVSAATISLWLKEHGYKPHTVWILETVVSNTNMAMEQAS